MNFKFASSAKPDEEQSRHESNLAREFAQDSEQIRSSSVAATDEARNWSATLVSARDGRHGGDHDYSE